VQGRGARAGQGLCCWPSAALHALTWLTCQPPARLCLSGQRGVQGEGKHAHAHARGLPSREGVQTLGKRVWHMGERRGSAKCCCERGLADFLPPGFPRGTGTPPPPPLPCLNLLARFLCSKFPDRCSKFPDRNLSPRDHRFSPKSTSFPLPQLDNHLDRELVLPQSANLS
jgi:hypothetical protein